MSTEAVRDESEGAAGFAAGAHEDFRDAIARHRRTAWRVTAACAAAYLVLGLVVAMLMAPLLYCVAGLALDTVNLAVATPDLLGAAGRTIERTFFSGKPVAIEPALRVATLAAAPGLALYVVAMFAIRRALLLSPVFERGPTRGEALGRAPNPGASRGDEDCRHDRRDGRRGRRSAAACRLCRRLAQRRLVWHGRRQRHRADRRECHGR